MLHLASLACGLTFSPPVLIGDFADNCWAAGGTDGFYALSADGSEVLGPCSQNSIKYTADGGKSWSLLAFDPPGSEPKRYPPGAQYSYNLIPEPQADGSTQYHTWSGMDVGAGTSSARGWSGDASAGRFRVAANRTLVLEALPRRVTISGLPQDKNLTFGPDGRPLAPILYGGPLKRTDGSYLATVGLAWAGQPVVPSPDGPRQRVSVVAIASQDGFAWHYLSTVLNASQMPHSRLGPSENDISYLADGKIEMIRAMCDEVPRAPRPWAQPGVGRSLG